MVSIVTVAYNALPGLKETVASVRSQTSEDYEHVVVDGGSTDGTPEWLNEQEDVIWISELDEGIADAVNKGLCITRGEWILVLHAEDTFLNSASLSTAQEHLDSVFDIVSFDVLFAASTGSRVFPSKGFSPRLNLKTTIPHQGAFCRSSLFRRLGGFERNLRVGMDYEFFLRAYRAGARVHVVNETLSRMPDSGISSRLDWPSLKRRFAEEHQIHLQHCRGPVQRLGYAFYQPIYVTYRKARHLIGQCIKRSEPE